MKLPINQIIHGNCLEVMKDWPDNCVDLVLTDPPYGINKKLTDGGGKRKYQKSRRLYIGKTWDKNPITKKEINSMLRIGRNQIIFGGNYFKMPPCRCFLIWDKLNHLPTMSRVEFIWTSFDLPAKYFAVRATQKIRIHPTQKPINLLLTILNKYSKSTDLIIDPYCGSGTTCVAAKMLGRRYIGIDTDSEYCQITEDRLKGVRSSLLRSLKKKTPEQTLGIKTKKRRIK